jgi:hypothetical protein
MLATFLLATLDAIAAGSFAVIASIMLSDPETRAAVLKNPRSYWK